MAAACAGMPAAVAKMKTVVVMVVVVVVAAAVGRRGGTTAATHVIVLRVLPRVGLPRVPKQVLALELYVGAVVAVEHPRVAPRDDQAALVAKLEGLRAGRGPFGQAEPALHASLVARALPGVGRGVHVLSNLTVHAL